MSSPSRNWAIASLFGGILFAGVAVAALPFSRWVALRQSASFAAVGCFVGGYFSTKRAIAFQEVLDEAIELDRQQQRLIHEATQPIVVAEIVSKEEQLSELRKEDFKLDAGEAFATVQLDKRPEWVKQQVKVAQSEAQSQPATADLNESPILDKLDEPVSLKPGADENLLAGVDPPISPDLGIKFFNWERFKKEPKLFPHIRAVGATGVGKTCLIDWLLDVFPADRTQVITVKRRVNQWAGLKVIGVPEDFDAIRLALDDLQAVRKKRTQKMAEGIDSPVLNVAVDEWRVITKNLKATVDRASKEILLPSAKEIMGNMITLAREVNIRMLVMAQGRQVETWGLEGESDLAECFCSIYLGKFAIEECESVRNRHPTNSRACEQYQAVRDYLESIGSRAAWISCADGEFPAIVPDLSGWKRGEKEDVKLAIEPVDSIKTATEDLPAELLDRARQRLQINFNSTSGDTSITSENGALGEAFEVPVEVQEVHNISASGDLEVLPTDEQSKALSRLLGLLSHGKLEVIELMPIEPDKALWLGLKTLKMRVTPASQNIFDCGGGGSKFQKAQSWYKNLESKFGKIVE
jgi:hypothetical protein